MVAKIHEIIARQLNKEKVGAGDTLEELGADSLDFVELVVALEDELDVEIPEQELEGIKTVFDMTATFFLATVHKSTLE